jgi:hypothetical protein
MCGRHSRPRKVGNQKSVTFGICRGIPLVAKVNYTYMVMAKAAAKPKSAMDTLVDSFSNLVEEARERMSPEEFQQAEKEFDEIVNKAKARASRGGRRETA